MNFLQALEIADPQKAGYVVRWPISGSTFNTRDYTSIQLVLSDLEAVIRSSLKERFDIEGPDLIVCIFINFSFYYC